MKKNQNVELILSTFFFLSEDEAKELDVVFSESKQINNFSDAHISFFFK